MIQTIEHIPKPSDKEIARVTKWLEAKRVMEACKIAEQFMHPNCTCGRPVFFHGGRVTEDYSNRALLGLLYLYAYKTGVSNPSSLPERRP